MGLNTLSSNSHTAQWFTSDERFQLLYPSAINHLADKYWTPLEVARLAAAFLAADGNVRILDIGSGVGSFCLAAAYFYPEAHYTGIEQRHKLVQHAENARNNLELQQVEFISGNFTDINFEQYDHFYFFNSFYENFPFSEKIDTSVVHSKELYTYYSCYLREQLNRKPAGTRLATFHSLEEEVPESYMVVSTGMENSLKCWIKM